jgi:hypothetical protein
MNQSFNINNNESNNGYSFLSDEVFHRFHVTNYLSPTFCDYCSQLLFGLIKQGLKCEFCAQNFHKRCVVSMPKICNHQLTIAMKSTSPKHSASFFDQNLENNIKFDIEHTFIKKQMFNIKRSTTKCDICQQKFTNDRVYLQCKDCNISIHEICFKSALKNCKPVSVNEDDNQNQIEDFDEQMNIDSNDVSDLKQIVSICFMFFKYIYKYNPGSKLYLSST